MKGCERAQKLCPKYTTRAALAGRRTHSFFAVPGLEKYRTDSIPKLSALLRNDVMKLIPLDWLVPWIPAALLWAPINTHLDQCLPDSIDLILPVSFCAAWSYCIVRLLQIRQPLNLFDKLRAAYLLCSVMIGTVPCWISAAMLADRSLDRIAIILVEQIAPEATASITTLKRSYGFDRTLEQRFELSRALSASELAARVGVTLKCSSSEAVAPNNCNRFRWSVSDMSDATHRIAFYIKPEEYDEALVADYDGDLCGHCTARFQLEDNGRTLVVRVNKF
jgi:hypothetical protein